MPDADEARLTERLQAAFEAEGYHALFGKTQGYYGPYVWRETVPAVYQVELPDGSAEYTVNLLKGFVFRSWMDYLTFGRYGTGGWASPTARSTASSRRMIWKASGSGSLS